MAQLTPSTKKTVCVSNFFTILAKQQVGLKEARSSVRNWPSFYTSWLPLWVDTHIRTFLCTVSSRHVLDHVKTTYEEVYSYIWQTPQVQRQTCTLSLRYKFIRSRCRQFHVLGLNNEEYSPKWFSYLRANYSWSDRIFCAVYFNFTAWVCTEKTLIFCGGESPGNTSEGRLGKQWRHVPPHVPLSTSIYHQSGNYINSYFTWYYSCTVA